MTRTNALLETVGNLDLDAVMGSLDEDGYCVIPNAISPERADEARAALDRLRQAEHQPAHDEARQQRVGRIAVKDPIFRELMTHPVTVGLWQRWLGEDVICSTWSGNTVLPGREAFGWHADFPYWAMTSPWPSGNLTGQTIWMLDDFTEENGATGVVPGSHRKLHRPDNPKQWRDDAKIVTGSRGSVAVFHGALWHTVRPNRTDQPRSCLLGMYIRPVFLTQEDMRGQLADINDPTDLERQLMGEHQWQPSDVE